MKKVGIIGWRGMVGSVLLQRMQEEHDFKYFDAHFFTTSQQGETAPDMGQIQKTLKDAHDLKALAEMDILLSCQGGDYTTKVFSPLRESGWQGYWVDAASTLRMDENSLIVLDPINQTQIEDGLEKGIKNYIGGNCTVSLMLLALHGLLKENLVKWISAMSYQAISGSGAQAMKELLAQQKYTLKDLDLNQNILEIEQGLRHASQEEGFPKSVISQPLNASLLPWIDSPMPSGQTREEWKAMVEANKILGPLKKPIAIDGTCVRVPSLRSHSQALTIKLRKDIPLAEIEKLIESGNPWVKFVKNNKEDTLNHLTPMAVSCTLDIAVGRVRKSLLGEKYLNLFTVGDQLLWGAAEPLRRVLKALL
ncbi:aspartate-semialdehyde dehydrogenase [Francisellaceae bacterium]|nr:aspartate-semialdehyde dehydrogenase [Francisellaceae bacterium]